jgi:hypothetical protein
VFEVRLDSGLLMSKKRMLVGKSDFGLCLVANLVYVVGGLLKDYNNSLSCEVHHLRKNIWAALPCLLPD